MVSDVRSRVVTKQRLICPRRRLAAGLHSVSTRTREIGIRIAIGAQPGAIFRMIIGDGLKLSLMGVIIGLGGAFWLTEAGSSLLFGVAASDPPTFGFVSALLIAVA